MDRRKFLKSFVGAFASVAIGMKLSQGMPELTQPSLDLVPENVIPMTVKMRFDITKESWADWRCVYGSPV